MASDEDYSDLTDIDSDDEYGESAVKRGKKPAGSNVRTGWRIKNALKVPRATTYTAQALYDQIYGGDINLEPEYQRDVVWSEAKQIGIIDSVFRNFYIPPVIFAVNVSEDGSETRTCIDGKQRLTSIHKFMEGLIPHKDPITGEKLYYKDIETSGRKRKLLPEKYRRLFANKQIVCVEYQDITDSDEREIFQRVQLGMALTPAEKLQVVKTPRTDLVRDLQSEYLKDDGWLGPKHLVWDQTRGSDFRGIAFSLYCIDTYAELKWTLVTMSRLEKWLNIEEPLNPETETAIQDTFRIFAEIVQDEKLKKVFASPPKISPVEFIGIVLLIFCNKDQASLAQLAAGVDEMRTAVRAEHIDVRLNTRVSKTILDFINNWVPKKIAGDKGGPANSSKSKVGVKRKRPVKASTEDSDDHAGGADKMDVDEAGGEAYRPKPKKLPKSKPDATPTPQVKTEPVASPPALPAARPPPANRMAALQRAKAAVAQNQAARAAMQAPTGPRALRAPEAPPNPQLLPSPTQPYSAFSGDLAAAVSMANGNGSGSGSHAQAHLPGRPSPAAAADPSLIAQPMRAAAAAVAAGSLRPGGLPPPPPSASSSTDTIHRSGDWDRLKDRERERDRDWDRERVRSREHEREWERARPSRDLERERYVRPYEERDRIRDRRESSGYLDPRSRSPSGRRPPR